MKIINMARRRLRGFVMLEAMLAVAIFAIGVLALGKCVTNCMAAEKFDADSARVWQALQNRASELQAGASPLSDREEPMAAPFEDIRMRQRCRPLSRRNENNVELTGIYAVTLEAQWQVGGEVRSQSIAFYVQPNVR